MSLNATITSILTRIQESTECQSDLERLEGEVLQFKVTDGEEYRLAFREGTVQLDNTATPTFRFEGRSDVLASIFDGKLTPLAAILTRRVKATLDPVRGPAIGRVIAAGLRQKAGDGA